MCTSFVKKTEDKALLLKKLNFSYEGIEDDEQIFTLNF